MEKLTGPKHNHLLTDLVKVCIFTLMLLLPFLCFLPTSLYYAFNEHAVVNTEEKPVYEYKQVDFNQNVDFIGSNIDYEYTLSDTYFFQRISSTPIIEGHQFYFKFYTDTIFNSDLLLYASTFLDGGNNIYISGLTNNNEFIATSGNTELWIVATCYNDYAITDDIHIKLNVYDLTKMFGAGNEPTISQFNQWYDNYYDYTLSKKEILKIDTGETKNYADITSNITNAWEDLWQSPLLVWTNYTPLNTGLNAFISIFGINQSSYIANCLIYLLSITAIYVVFDIVLGIFKWLTHLINK